MSADITFAGQRLRVVGQIETRENGEIMIPAFGMPLLPATVGDCGELAIDEAITTHVQLLGVAVVSENQVNYTFKPHKCP